MVLYIIGLGLGDKDDITVKGLNAVRKCSRVYLEHYTSILGSSKEDLEAFYGVPLILADREQVESFAHQILKGSDKEDVALLVVGDPFAYGYCYHFSSMMADQTSQVCDSQSHNSLRSGCSRPRSRHPRSGHS